METLILPSRFENIEKVDSLSKDWDLVKLAIRPDCRDEKSIEKAQKAIEVGLNDAAINYIWNLVIYDLHRKIISYGIEYFSSAINWEGKKLNTIEDLREVKDYQIISGTFSLGIIPHEAHFYLEQCREIRNNFSTAHFPMGELDKIETFNFIKNCIKYVLTYDLPAPGLQIKDLIENLSSEKLEKGEEICAIIENQSSKIHGPILHNLFSNYIKSDCNANLKYNVKMIAPSLWKIVSEDVKSSIAVKFASLREVKGKDGANEALSFLKLVNGVSYIPESYKEVIFKKHAQFLIDAHYEWNNFYNEPNFAKELDALGYEIPIASLNTYLKAVLLSYLGNYYGFSKDAQEYNEKMLLNLTQTGIRGLFRLIDQNVDIVRILSNIGPVNRLKSLMDLIKEKTMLPEQQKIFDFITKSSRCDVQKYFEEKYWKLAKL